MIYAYITISLAIVLYLVISSATNTKSSSKINTNLQKKKQNEKNVKYYINQIASNSKYIHFRKYVDKRLKKYTILKESKNKLIRRISIIQCISEEEAEKKLEINIISSILLSASLFCISLFFLEVIYLAFIISITMLYLYWHRFNTNIKKGIRKIEQSFPDIVQTFIDDYIVSKNAKNALLSITKRSNDGSIKMIFEKLIREIYSGTSWEYAIDEFSKTLKFFYAQAFSEILKLSLHEVGDISEELDELMNIMHEDIEKKEQTKSTIYENKLMFYIINASTFLVVNLNILFHPFAKEIYSYTIAGSTLLSLWLVQVIAGILFIEASENI